MLKTKTAVLALIAVSVCAIDASAGKLIPVGGTHLHTSVMTIAMPTRGSRAFKSSSAQSGRKKSERQKCLDMMLPQDGADCMKKLKAKDNN